MIDLKPDNRTKVIVHIINPKTEYELYFDNRNEIIKLISGMDWRTINDLILFNDDYGNLIYVPYSNIGLIEVI